MPIPKTVTKVSKNGITFVDNVDRASYTIQELVRAAQRDTAKFLRNRLIQKFKELPGMKRRKRIYKSVRYWVGKRDGDLMIGLNHNTWYSALSEMGGFTTGGKDHGPRRVPARNILRGTVMENIPTIRAIQAQYLSAIENDMKAKALIDEAEQGDNGGPEETVR